MSGRPRRDPDVDPWSVRARGAASKGWVSADLRAWSAGQRYTAAIAAVFCLIVITTSRGPASEADNFLDGVGITETTDAADTATPSATPADDADNETPVPPPEPLPPAALPPVPPTDEEPRPAPSPPPSPPAPPPDETDEPSPLPTLPVPLPLP